MANIHLESLDEIFSASLEIQTLIKNCKPYSITEKEVDDLLEDFVLHIREMTGAVELIVRIKEAK